MTSCDLQAPRHAFAGEPVRVSCRVDGAPPMAEVTVRIDARDGATETSLAELRFVASPTGSGRGSTRITLGGGAGPTPVTLVATPLVDGRPGAADTAVVTVR